MDGEPGTTLTVDDLMLRPWRHSDASAVFAACQDPEIARWVTIPQPYRAADADAFIEGTQAMWRDGTGAPFAITSQNSAGTTWEAGSTQTVTWDVAGTTAPQFDAAQAAKGGLYIGGIASWRKIDDNTIEIITKVVDAVLP